MLRVDAFPGMTVSDYHENLIHFWLRLSKDGLVKKDHEVLFGIYGANVFTFLKQNKRFPTYEEIISFPIYSV